MHKHKDTETRGQVVVLSVVLSQCKLMVVHTKYEGVPHTYEKKTYVLIEKNHFPFGVGWKLPTFTNLLLDTSL